MASPRVLGWALNPDVAPWRPEPRVTRARACCTATSSGAPGSSRSASSHQRRAAPTSPSFKAARAPLRQQRPRGRGLRVVGCGPGLRPGWAAEQGSLLSGRRDLGFGFPLKLPLFCCGTHPLLRGTRRRGRALLLRARAPRVRLGRYGWAGTAGPRGRALLRARAPPVRLGRYGWAGTAGPVRLGAAGASCRGAMCDSQRAGRAAACVAGV